jgi:hypothetical protein
MDMYSRWWLMRAGRKGERCSDAGTCRVPLFIYVCVWVHIHSDVGYCVMCMFEAHQGAHSNRRERHYFRVCIYTCMCAFFYVNVRVHIFLRPWTYLYGYGCVNICKSHLCICSCIQWLFLQGSAGVFCRPLFINMCVHAYMYVFMYICAHAYTYMAEYILAYIQTCILGWIRALIRMNHAHARMHTHM